MDATSVVVTLAVGIGGVLLTAWLTSRNDRRSRSDELLASAANDAVHAIARVAASNSTDAQAQADYAAALSRVAMHGRPPVVAAWRAFQDEGTTGTTVGRDRLIAAIQATRAQLGHGIATEDDLRVLLFGAGELHEVSRNT